MILDVMRTMYKSIPIIGDQFDTEYRFIIGVQAYEEWLQILDKHTLNPNNKTPMQKTFFRGVPVLVDSSLPYNNITLFKQIKKEDIS
ncbi:MAG: hypothetical protein FJ150_08575 [Euryarchaeota archaeon]|nr:hypothetical protein [Euryarchaeota archaeon]